MQPVGIMCEALNSIGAALCVTGRRTRLIAVHLSVLQLLMMDKKLDHLVSTLTAVAQRQAAAPAPARPAVEQSV